MSLEELSKIERQDPLLFSARILMDNRCLRSSDIINLYEECRKRVNKIFEYASSRPKLIDSDEIMSTIVSNVSNTIKPEIPKQIDRKKIFGKEYSRLDKK